MKHRKQKRRKPYRPIAHFLKIVCCMVLAFVACATGAIFAYSRIVGFETQHEVTSGSQMSIVDAIIKRDITLNVAFFGVDGDETRTDVMFVVHFDSKTGNLNLLSVPRDTRVTMTDELYNYLSENGMYIPPNATCKLNEVHAYAGTERGDYFSVKQLEELLGIQIDHYVKVNFEGFRELVDLVGGVDFYVPQDMYWDMRDTGDPLINLKEGMQHLDGDKAEQLVRFRRYVQGDIERVSVQQDFLRALMEKILSTDTLLGNLPGLIRTAYQYVTTDISLSDALKYAPYIEDVDVDRMQTATLPGTAQNISGISYYIEDQTASHLLVQQYFFNDEAMAQATSNTTNSKDLAIEIANGSYTTGYAATNQQMLTASGYQVPTISTYEGEKTSYTRIYVREDGVGQDLLRFYPDAQFYTDPTMLNDGIDIYIILGTDE